MGKKARSKSGLADGYLHGFSDWEQARLRRQARFLESTVYSRVDFSHHSKIIEVGCGVGAQTEILLERFSHLKVEGIDASDRQIVAAKSYFKKLGNLGKQAHFQVADALHLPFEDNTFDGAFICWFLEHVKNPVEILAQVRRVLKPGGILYCNEVLNASLYLHPYSPATLQYWFHFNDHQWSLGGDPFVGAKLANYLIDAGFQNIHTQFVSEHYDNRMPKRRQQAFDFWTELFLSGAPELLKSKKVSQKLVDQMTQEFKQLKDAPDSAFFLGFMQASAQVF